MARIHFDNSGNILLVDPDNSLPEPAQRAVTLDFDATTNAPIITAIQANPAEFQMEGRNLTHNGLPVKINPDPVGEMPALVGPAGPAGEQGPIGLTGPEGPAGTAGATLEEIDTLIAGKADTVHTHPENAPVAHTHLLTDLPHNHNNLYYTDNEVDTLLAGKVTSNDPRLSDARTPTPHNHDATYFTEAEVTTLLSGKSDAGHTHAGGGSATPRESLEASWGASIIKTNIGAAFVDVYNQAGADGKSVQIDTTGKTEVKLMVLWNKIGTGTHTVQVLEVGTANVLISLNVVSGRNVSALTAIPAFAANSVKFYKLQCKSTTAADDPVFEGARVYLK